MDNKIPVVVRMHVECAKCGHTEDETYEFDMPFTNSQPLEAYEPGKCPECGEPIPDAPEAHAAAAIGAYHLSADSSALPAASAWQLPQR
jgi:endogenous inhibitor of DNA gyrase (YacG/DUF329 family)